ncbi:hypothetical protein [Butyrivibrio sp. XPD2006]|uniref:hypothetical protein n=1 Tax=Butyrivibrio sp. XPD2006 TaxID=1280668 RepID=UPI0003B5B364|nr:hypothetical protein [Butyrivibrio sp. XPD2006]
MNIQTIVNQMGIEILAFLVCMFFGIRLIVTRDVKIIKKDNPESIKHPREYTFYAGLIIIFLGVSAIAMGIVSFFDQIAALILIVVAVVIMGFMWKFVHEKYAE